MFARLALAYCSAASSALNANGVSAAGLRTNTLVCLCVAASVSLGLAVGDSGTTSTISYVISGVGFLGAGAIIKQRAGIRGLNT